MRLECLRRHQYYAENSGVSDSKNSSVLFCKWGKEAWERGLLRLSTVQRISPPILWMCHFLGCRSRFLVDCLGRMQLSSIKIHTNNAMDKEKSSTSQHMAHFVAFIKSISCIYVDFVGFVDFLFLHEISMIRCLSMLVFECVVLKWFLSILYELSHGI